MTRLVTGWALWLVAASCSLATITVTDDSGETVVLSTPARKIVSLSPHITEILFELGVGDRIVGTVRYSDHPPAALEIPRVGDAFSVNVESVVNIEPDIVFAWATGGAGQALNQLQSLGFPVYIDHARNLESIAHSVRRMARLVGQRERGEELAEGYLETLKTIAEKHSAEQGTRVFFQISDRDLYTVSRSHFMGQAIELCGGENLFAESAVPIPKVSQEAVLAADPDVIIISQPDQNNESPWVKKWHAHESLNGKVKIIDSDLISRPSLRMLEGIKSLCRLMETP